MAALIVQSRFAGLQVEDDDYPPSADVQKVKKAKPSTAKKPEPPKKIKSIPNKSQNGNQNKKKKVKANATTAEQWEQWKQKDEELVDGNFECELQEAILLSKLDFEEKKDVYKQTKKEGDNIRKAVEQSRASSKKQKKKNVMSLVQFNDMVSNGDEKYTHIDDKSGSDEQFPPDPDAEYFDRVQDEAKTEIVRDKIIDIVKQRQPVSDEVINRVQFAEALERKDKEIAMLKQEVTGLKSELLTVKSRNKKLCNILGQGEMKDKAEVLIEVERLRVVQGELMAELDSLHTQLERERSRPADTRTKDKKKKGGIAEKDKDK